MKTVEQIRKARTNKIMKYGCLPIVILFGVLAIIFAVTDDGIAEPNPSRAYEVSKAYVKTQLESPESAEFPTYPFKKEVFQDTLYRVVSDVTMQNAFGVKSKIRYMMILQHIEGDAYDPSNWKVIDFVK